MIFCADEFDVATRYLVRTCMSSGWDISLGRHDIAPSGRNISPGWNIIGLQCVCPRELWQLWKTRDCQSRNIAFYYNESISSISPSLSTALGSPFSATQESSWPTHHRCFSFLSNVMVMLCLVETHWGHSRSKSRWAETITRCLQFGIQQYIRVQIVWALQQFLGRPTCEELVEKRHTK